MKNKGFTIIELTLIAAVIGIIASVVLPAFVKGEPIITGHTSYAIKNSNIDQEQLLQ